MRVYHFLKRDHGLDNIRHRRLKIATLNDLNDPFEMLAMTLRDPELRQAFRATKAQMDKRAGMLCFSRDWHNPVQWSHYADRHRGICIGFDIPDEIAAPVSYSRRRLPVDRERLEGPDAEAFMRTVISTKFAHWRYENEVRLFITLADRDADTKLWFQDFGPELVLKEVIIGDACDVKRKELADALADLDPNVTKRKARLSFQRFAVVTQRRSSLWK